ncbi:P-loop containing nucleoside triphosphate hydrolase protein [Gilbertella persicaria]|uniref:P-loop containing nucleoside triphosphate hydrolase protein n=1 Tax=Gilbertella persicaria TaxID=101096 RepID=UPI00221E3953|nr:P-loop containing nucleoside triphosphate hydrolase protein [Gilbertella persicaria]KAI8076629.1 P-loop containing nucleoside triphosphate hydrolase protein [Gilbertella persicaria]
MPKPLIVQYTPIRSCLVNLPNKWVNALLDQKKEGQKVQVEFCRNVPECTTVHVEPLTEDDWEILELHAGYVEENLLSQLRVVYTHQTICVWIHGKTLVRLAVASIEPKQDYVKLTNQSEVIVAPKVRKSNQSVEEVSELNNQAIIQKTQPSVRLRACSVQLEMDSLSVHVHPDSIESLLNSNGDMPSVIRLTKLLPGFSKSNKEEQQESDNDQYSPVKAVFARIYVSLSVPLNHVVIGSILKSTLEIKDFDIVKVATTTIKKSPLGSLVLKRCVNNSNNNNTIKLGLDNTQTQQKLNFEASVTKSIQTWLSQFTQDVVLSQGLLIDLEVDNKKEQFVTQLDAKKGFFGSNTASGEIEYTTLVPQQSVSIGFGEQVQKQPTKQNQSKPVIALGGVDTMLRKMEQYALANLSKRDLKYSLSVPGSGGVLVTGAHGSGKTSVVKHILNFCHNYHIYTIEINCSEIADERIPVFKEMLQKWFDEAAWHGPSVIFFDDLDRLVPAEVEHADSTRSRHLAELFVQTARIACQRHSIMLIATSQQQQSIHPALITHHIFSELKHLQPPNRDERKQIIQTIMSHGPSVLSSSLPSIDLVMVASETEGFLATDLKALIERTVHEGAIRSIKDNNREETEKKELKLIQADFTQAREGFVPSSLRGVKLQSSGVNWSDIGGLNETRKALLETLEWPTKYAAVFAQCPLRLRSGVKGPEILNKYIGASEKSVRDLFERAQAAKPCVLFFDEFDSIAPRRGHDSTGVTDRVVNQMLTQMDGAEGLNGVYVLAATSRPDLIDPALLRPGRLDKALLCGMPSFEERLEILEALSSKMQLAPDVDLKIYAEKTQGFSGADLQGFLYNAHLEAIHGTIDIESFKEAQDVKSKVTEKSDFVMNARQAPLTLAEKGQISQRLAMIKNRKSSQTKVITETVTNQPQEAVITTSYLEKSFKSTRPSITAEEAYRLGLIYNEFVTGRTGELPSGEGAKGIGKRSTLG